MRSRILALIVLAVVGRGAAWGQVQAAAGPGAPGGPGVHEDPFAKVAPAEAAAALARAHLRTTESEIQDLVRSQRFVFENSKAYRDALTEQQKAHMDMEAARRKALAALEIDPEYAASKKIREDLSFKLSEAHGARKPDRAEIEGLTQYRMRLGEKMSARESDELSASTDYADAKMALAAASAKLDDLKREFDVSLRTSPMLASARKTWRGAMENLDAASTYSDSTIRTANILINYAYFSQLISTYRPNVILGGGYGYPGYGGYAPYSGSGVGAVTPASVPPTATTGAGFGLIPGR